MTDEAVEGVEGGEDAFAVKNVAGRFARGQADGEEGGVQEAELLAAVEEGDVDAPLVGGVAVEKGVVAVGKGSAGGEVQEYPAVFDFRHAD